MRVGYDSFLLRPNGREIMGAVFPNAARPNGRWHWAPIVAHSVRWPLNAAYAKRPSWRTERFIMIMWAGSSSVRYKNVCFTNDNLLKTCVSLRKKLFLFSARFE